jgi:hypothetical protein
MGTYVYVARKRPIDVCVDGKVVQAYPLEYFSKYYDVSRAWDDGLYFRNECQKEWNRSTRMALGRAIRAMEGVKVEYVFMSSMNEPIKPLSGSQLYRFTSGFPLDHIAYIDDESSCYDGPPIFWTDVDDPGELVGALVRPTRVGRKLGSWTVEPFEERHWEVANADAKRLDAKRRARKARREGRAA